VIPTLRKLRLLPVFLIALSLIGGSLAIDPGAVRPAEALTNCSVADYGINADEQAFLTLINNYRAQNGAPALQISTGLSRMSSWHAEDMAAKNYFSHTDSLGRGFATRLGQCDASGGSAGENIAAGYQTAQDVFNGWKNSPGHNANMLNASYRYIGIARVTGGSYGVYWVTDLSSINPSAGGSGGGSTPTPPPAQVAATMTSPAPGSTISSPSATFSWSSAAGADEYFLYAGTYAGSNNLYGRSQGLNRSVTVSNLPAGRTVYVRLWTRDGSTWRYIDYTYRTR
jgi:hypothetical protein